MVELTWKGRVEAKAKTTGLPIVQITTRTLKLTLATNPMTNDTKCELNMTKKYTVASSNIIRKMPGWPFGSDNPVLRLMKTTTEKAMASKNGGRLREICERMRVTNYQRIGKVTCMQSRHEETWQIHTGDRPGGVSIAFRELREQRIIACSDHTIYRVPGLLAAIPTMYIPMADCTRVMAEKNAMTRFFPRVRAYKLSNESVIASTPPVTRKPYRAVSVTCARRVLQENDKTEKNAVLSHLFKMRIQRRAAGKVLVHLEWSDSFIVHEKAGSLRW